MEKNIEMALTTLVISDDESIFVEPVCKFFGINFKNQRERILEDPILQSESGKKHHESTFSDKRLRLCLGKRGFIRWIQIINPVIVRPELQKLFIKYQVAIFDSLYNGSGNKVMQLEDIRNYALNINSALGLKDQIMEYITEQKNHRDLCLQSTPENWVSIKPTLTAEKQLPAAANSFKAIAAALPNTENELMYLKKRLLSNLSKDRSLLLYQSKFHLPEENPMPDGFRRETIKIRMKQSETKIDEIDQKLLKMRS